MAVERPHSPAESGQIRGLRSDGIHKAVPKRKPHRVSVVLSKKYDADIIAHLDRQESKSNYIKTLIRADIQKKRKVNDATQKHNFIIKNTITFPSDRNQNRDTKKRERYGYNVSRKYPIHVQMKGTEKIYHE